MDRTTLQPADLAAVDEFHIRGRRATLEIIEALALTADSHVLDLGSGLGGPARTLAELTAMNITDKHSLDAEAFRVLRPGGRFVVYDVLQGEGGEVHYPVPWAADSSTSFPATLEEMRDLLPSAGFDVVSEVDSSNESRVWFQQMLAKIQREGPPPVTFATFLGDNFAQMTANQVANLAERRIRTVMFVCSKP